MKRIVATIFLYTALLASCVDADSLWKDWTFDGGFGNDRQVSIGDTVAGLVSLSITPEDATIAQDLNQTATLTYKVMGLFAGGERDVSGAAAFSLKDDSFGVFKGPTLTPIKNLGGKTTVKAEVGSLSVSTGVTLKVRTSVVATGAPTDAATWFTSPCTGGTTFKMAYPETGAMVPPNLADFSVMWSDSISDLWQITLQSDSSEVKVYTVQQKHRLSAAIWQLLAYSNVQGAVEISITGVKKASPATCALSDKVQVIVGPGEIKGGIYYWVTAPDNAIMRYDFGQSDKKPESYLSQKGMGYCVGCHAISPDGSRLAFADDKDYGGIMEVKTKKLLTTKTPTVDKPPKAYFQAFTPDNKYIFTSYVGKMTIRDGATGAELSQVTGLGTAVSQPEISPAGDALVYVIAGDNQGGLNFWGGSIAVATLSGTTLGKPKTIVQGNINQNNYYPSFSPDGEWIVFNRVKLRSYSNNEAEMWVVKTTGGTPILLSKANQAANLRNSWARWSPFTQMHKGNKLFWFSFSSIRDYGTELPNTKNGIQNAIPQIWMTAFDTSLAEKGQDPTFPAFWLPYQDLTSKNHIAQWTKKVPVVN